MMREDKNSKVRLYAPDEVEFVELLRKLDDTERINYLSYLIALAERREPSLDPLDLESDKNE